MQIAPTDTETKSELSNEVKAAKAWFESNRNVSNVNNNCNSGRNFTPRWDRSKDRDDRMEFDVFENNKISLPKISSLGLKFGRKKYVYKKSNGNSNGNNGNNEQDAIVSFVPAATFTGDINKVSVSIQPSQAY